VERIDLADFLLIAEIHTGIDARRLARMDRVVQLAASALLAPFAGYGDVEAHPTFEKKAAVHASRIVRYHPLPDGNKRTAYDVMREFIERNGHTFEHPPGGLMESAEMIENLAADRITEDELAAWLADRITRP
jgi:death-on-curing protein